MNGVINEVSIYLSFAIAVGQALTVTSTSPDIVATAPRPPGRVLRPMIVAKQLDLPEGPTGADVPAALPMPRTQLTRELEKYSRPASAAIGTESTGAETPVGSVMWSFCLSLQKNESRPQIYK